MIDSAALTAALQKVVLELEDDLRARVEGDAELCGRWIAEHHQAVERGRTASAWVAWRDDRVTQAAVGWVLTSVFVRFCEDNGLVQPVWIAGREHRRQEALDAQLAYFRAHPMDTDREWLQQAVAHLASLPATRDLVGEHAALHLVSPSGDAVTKLFAFWRRRDDEGLLVHDLTDASLSTRFLGDLYQDLSAYAKATYALLQTPEFVEEFILDRTLEPALDDRPLEGFRMIDPTCGSGHFLLGAFRRLLDRWHKRAPALEQQALVQQALDAVHGVDLNPFAVAIARFRLTVAALQACGLRSLEKAPAFRFHLAVGDSLLHGSGQQTLDGDAQFSGFAYATEDLEALQSMLADGRYDAVVGNPPYILVKDKVLNRAYRDRYSTCRGTYALSVPFMERFFGLASLGHDGRPAGWVGQITSNSFMKRGFGRHLVERFLTKQDLRLIVDAEGAWIPGHNMDGTPTVIIVGRRASQAGSVRLVRGTGVREVRTAEALAGLGPLWRSLLRHVDAVGHRDEWLEIVDLDPAQLRVHPWVFAGDAARELNALLASGPSKLSDLVEPGIGRAVRIGADDAFIRPRRSGVTRANPMRLLPYLEGEDVRDYRADTHLYAWYPYNNGVADAGGLEVELWPFRTLLAARSTFAGNMAAAGRHWWEYMQHTASAYTTRTSITFSNIASHNHFAIDRGGRIFNAHAPILKPARAEDLDLCYELLSVLGASTTAFWMRRNSQPKGGAAEVTASRTFEFTGTMLAELPLPSVMDGERGRVIDDLAMQLSKLEPERVIASTLPTLEILREAASKWCTILSQLIAQQEELDWAVYSAYGLTDADVTYGGRELPGIEVGQRAFEMFPSQRNTMDVTAPRGSSPSEDSSTPDLPTGWSKSYRDVVLRRSEVLRSNRLVALLERPEYKRRWASEPWEKRQERALRMWLLDRIEDRRFWFDAQGRPAPKSVAQLSDEVARDADLVSVLALWEGRPDAPVTESLVKLLEPEAVPYLAAYRYKDSGLRTREAWEQTWDLQRREDAGERVGTIPVPPKYTSADFRKPSYWQARGKLDVPKERFVLYPDAGRDTDPTPLLGWAGWDHAQQSLALSLIIGAREADGWTDERLVPLVAGLAELQPWVDQWHGEVDPTYGVSLAAFTREQLTQRMTQVGRSLDELRAWRPAAPTRGRKPKVT